MQLKICIDPDSHIDTEIKEASEIGGHSESFLLVIVVVLVGIIHGPTLFEYRKIDYLKVGNEVAFGLWRNEGSAMTTAPKDYRSTLTTVYSK